MSVAEEVAWLAEQNQGESGASLLEVPATVYYAIKDRTIARLLREQHRAKQEQAASNRRALMDDFKARMGRTR